MEFAIGGVVVALLIVGIVEAAKEFGVSGNGSRILALCLGVFFAGLSQALTQGLVPEVAVIWIEIAVKAIAGGLAAMGYYDLGKRFTQ